MRNMDIKEMDYRKAQTKDAKAITDIVQQTIAEIYPKYYPKEIVDFFGQLHCCEHIDRDIRKGIVYVLEAGGILVGTGSYEGSHITRVYVLPQHQGKGYGSHILMNLENEISIRHQNILLDASLPACKFYESKGYKTIKHEELPCGNEIVLVYDIMEKAAQKHNKISLSNLPI